MTASAAIASSVRRSSSVTRRISVKPTDSAPLSSPSHTIGTPAAVWISPSDSCAVSISVRYALVTNGLPVVSTRPATPSPRLSTMPVQSSGVLWPAVATPPPDPSAR